MIVSYFLAQTFVPVMANWIMKVKHHKRDDGKEMTDEEEFAAAGFNASSEADTWNQKASLIEKNVHKDKLSPFERIRKNYLNFIGRMMPHRKLIVIIYLMLVCLGAGFLIKSIGHDVLPKVNGGQFLVRMRLPDGTRIEHTELTTLQLLDSINKIVGKENISITSAYVGMHPQLFSVSPIFLWMAGPHESVLQIALKENVKVDLDELKDKIRNTTKLIDNKIKLSFEPIELTDKILSQGSPTPVEVRFSGRDKKMNEFYAHQLIEHLNKIPYLRDIQIGQSIKYPAININIDRIRAAQLGVDISDVSRSLIASTSSSRYTEKNTWIDQKAGVTYAVQVEVPESKMNSREDLGEIPLLKNASRPLLGDVATFSVDSTYGEIDNLGAMPVLTVTANLFKKDLGSASNDVNKAISDLGKLPRGINVELIGLSNTLNETLNSLQSGLLVALIVIFLMLAANFQSFKVSAIVLTTAPAVLLGSLALLIMCGSTLNLQSYMGMIMSVGVSISNAVLLITNAEQLRMHNGDAILSAKEAAALRLRPIVMTAAAMVVGMIPMALGIGEAGDQSSPLGRAVIGGLVLSTFAALFILPLVFAWGQGKASTTSVSLDPEDEESSHYIPSLHHV
jgi:multidrug efflux pump subunit AcrB